MTGRDAGHFRGLNDKSGYSIQEMVSSPAHSETIKKHKKPLFGFEDNT
jgi:hypothetical protein